jgi:hypothetical protein
VEHRKLEGSLLGGKLVKQFLISTRRKAAVMRTKQVNVEIFSETRILLSA